MNFSKSGILSFCLAAMILAGLAGCGKPTPAGVQTDTADITTAVISETTAAETEAKRTIEVKSASDCAGDMILVNSSHPFIFPDNQELTNLFLVSNDCYKLGGTDLSLAPEACDALLKMTADFSAASGRTDVIVLSAWRSYEDQDAIYAERVQSRGEDYARMYVANPGYSEHHTGLAADISVYTDDGESKLFSADPAYAWIDEHCAEYGFILRYPGDKYDITQVAHEEWHYRFVGKPHAEYMYQNGICLEEYIDLLRTRTDPEAPLEVTCADGSAWKIYTAPVSAGETTKITVPYTGDVNVSGSNCGFFIVTVED